MIKSDAMNYVKELIENPAGIILITNKRDQNMSVEDSLKALMLKEIKTNKAFDDVYKKTKLSFNQLKSIIRALNMNISLVGYPSQAFEYKGSAIFIYQDTNTISDAFNYIAIIIF